MRVKTKRSLRKKKLHFLRTLGKSHKVIMNICCIDLKKNEIEKKNIFHGSIQTNFSCARLLIMEGGYLI